MAKFVSNQEKVRKCPMLFLWDMMPCTTEKLIRYFIVASLNSVSPVRSSAIRSRSLAREILNQMRNQGYCKSEDVMTKKGDRLLKRVWTPLVKPPLPKEHGRT